MEEYTYPVIIKYEPDESSYPYLVEIPVLDGMTEGKDIPNAIDMAADYIGTYSLESKMPKSVYELPSVGKGEIATLVKVNVEKYRIKNDNKSVKKTLTIPNYLNELGKEHKINFSAVLTDALKEKLDA